MNKKEKLLIKQIEFLKEKYEFLNVKIHVRNWKQYIELNKLNTLDLKTPKYGFLGFKDFLINIANVDKLDLKEHKDYNQLDVFVYNINNMVIDESSLKGLNFKIHF